MCREPQIGDGSIGDFFCIETLAKQQSGYFTAEQAASCGFSWALCSYHFKTGKFLRVRRGLYRFASYPASRFEAGVAAWLALGGPGVAISHDTALALYGFTELTIPVHITLDRRLRRSAVGGVRIHTTTHFPQSHDLIEIYGMMATNAARSILDWAAAGGDPARIISATKAALRTGQLSDAELRALSQGRSGKVRALALSALR